MACSSPPCWNSTAWHARLDSLVTSNVSSRVETWRDEPSGIWLRGITRPKHMQAKSATYCSSQEMKLVLQQLLFYTKMLVKSRHRILRKLYAPSSYWTRVRYSRPVGSMMPNADWTLRSSKRHGKFSFLCRAFFSCSISETRNSFGSSVISRTQNHS